MIALLLRLSAELGPAPLAGAPIPEGLSAELRAITTQFGVDLDAAATLTVVTVWTWLIGAVGQETFSGFGDQTFADPGAIFEAQLEQQLAAAFGR